MIVLIQNNSSSTNTPQSKLLHTSSSPFPFFTFAVNTFLGFILVLSASSARSLPSDQPHLPASSLKLLSKQTLGFTDLMIVPKPK
jgi:hypothetical protein